MRHILIIIRHNIVSLKFLTVVLSMTVMIVTFQLSNVLTVHAINLRTEIKADPPGIVNIIYDTEDPPAGTTDPDDDSPTPTNDGDTYFTDTYISETQPDEPTALSNDANTQDMPPGQVKKSGGGGSAKPKVVNPKSNRSTILTINTPIDFGNVFPGETLEDHFTISLSSDNITPYENVTYHITVIVKGGYLDLTPYLNVQLSAAEQTAGETDNITSATLGPPGPGPGTDDSDEWRVILNLPHDAPDGDYWTLITIHVDDPTTTP